MKVSLKDKVILITGSTRGIGEASARFLAKAGANIIVNYKNSSESAERLVKELGNDSISIKGDVRNKEDVKKMFDLIKEKYGKLDILINNAGVLKDSLLIMTDEETYDYVLDTNLKGCFLCMQQASKLMMKQKKGKIINISSIIGINGNSGQVHYAASKAGVIGMTRSAAKELGRFGITVNAVAPGFVETDMIRDLKDEFKKKIINGIVLGRAAIPDDIAKVILFLSSDLSDYISGQVIGVDGCQVI
jgi:3-oxoacyl-[acyl-carrier protein] reductase